MAFEWALMIVAMMWPLVIPHVGHVAARSFADQQNSVVGFFLGGYAAVWFAAAAAASTMLISLHALLEFLSLGSVAGLIGCLFAATWQISAVKRRVLNRCHGTLPLRAFGSAANCDALRFGITQGGRCVASCIPVMVLPLLAGLGFGMMIVLFAIVLAERARHTPQFHGSALVLVLLGLLSVGR
jgi:predicted metal-binding membrane protein